MTDSISPCPFCGGKADVPFDPAGMMFDASINCSRCLASGPCPDPGQSHADAWNTRAQPASDPNSDWENTFGPHYEVDEDDDELPLADGDLSIAGSHSGSSGLADRQLVKPASEPKPYPAVMDCFGMADKPTREAPNVLMSLGYKYGRDGWTRPAPAGVDHEREQFEKEFSESPLFLLEQDRKERKDSDFVYKNFVTDMAWVAWQARAKLNGAPK